MTHRPNQAGHLACHSNKIFHSFIYNKTHIHVKSAAINYKLEMDKLLGRVVLLAVGIKVCIVILNCFAVSVLIWFM